MFNIGLLALTLCAGTIVEPFRIADAEPGHHQGCLRVAMASDGHFAVAWVDYLHISPHDDHEDLYIRFFDQDGNPLTDPCKITKAADTNEIGGSHLGMDSQGNTVLIWTEHPWPDPNEGFLRLQLFDPSGSPLGSPQTDHQGYVSWNNRSVAVSLNDQSEFAIVWDAEVICARRYSLQSGPQGDPFMVHDDPPDGVGCNYPGVALNDAGDLVVTWHEFRLPPNATSYPRFQVFDAENKPILGWEPRGHLVNEDSSRGSRVEAYWLDNDRFVMFWKDPSGYPIIVGRVFSDRGLTRHPIRGLIWWDSLWCAHGGSEGWYSTAVSPNDSFAYTHIRSYTDHPDTSDPSKLRWWDHGGGILGYIQDNEPIRRTTLFEYTPPWGADTVNCWTHNQPPAVACCDDRIVWVYSRLNTDTIFEAFVIITDWDMGVGVAERPVFTQSPIRLSASLNRLFYDVSGSVTGKAKLTLYSADGRKVLTETIEGKGIWEAPTLPSGVYFARVEGESAKARAKVVILH